MKCVHKDCQQESAITKEGFQVLDCEKHLYQCIWTGCKRKKTTSWFCKLHFLAKEANYGLNDTDPENEDPGKKPGGEFYQWGVERLRDFALYVIDEGII